MRAFFSNRFFVFGAFMILMALLLNLLIPPFQNPDEPLHFSLIMHYAANGGSRNIEKEIIYIMDRFGWWDHVGLGKPAILPERFSDISFFQFGDDPSQFGWLKGFHFTTGKLLSLFSINEVLPAYYCCRMLSFFAVAGSWLLLFLAFHRIFPSSGSYLMIAPLFALFLPQMNVLALSVNPDGLVIFLATLFFFLCLRAFYSDSGYRYLVFLIPIALAGFFIDNSGFFILILVIILPLFLSGRFTQPAFWFKAAVSGGLFFLILSWVVWFVPLVYYGNLKSVRRIIIDQLPETWRFFSLDIFQIHYLTQLQDSFLLQFGWMAFRSHPVFYMIWRIFLALSVLGMILFAAKTLGKKLKKYPGFRSDDPYVRIAGFSVLAVVVQFFGLWWAQGSRGYLPQGRYFLPLILPVTVLLFTGLFELFRRISPALGRVVLPIIVLLEFIFLNYCIWNDVVPVFHLKMLSPHAGL